jgi:hypothetical protein
MWKSRGCWVTVNARWCRSQSTFLRLNDGDIGGQRGGEGAVVPVIEGPPNTAPRVRCVVHELGALACENHVLPAGERVARCVEGSGRGREGGGDAAAADDEDASKVVVGGWGPRHRHAAVGERGKTRHGAGCLLI